MYYLSDVFDRLFDDFFRSGCFNLRDVNVQKTSSNGFPTHPVSNLYLNEKGTAVFEFAAPGFGKDDVTVEVEDNRLIVEGKNPDNDSNFPQNDATEEVEGRKYIHRNIAKRSFKNVYKVPAEYNLAETKVTLKDGLLTIELPLKTPKEYERKLLEIN